MSTKLVPPPSSSLGNLPKVHKDVYDFISPARLSGTLSGKNALITGASRGIGRATALSFAAAGASVALLARTESQLEELAADIRTKYGTQVLVLVADATDDRAVSAAVRKAEWELGGMDVVVANAGVSASRPLVFTPMEEWWRIMEVNVKGQMCVVQEVLKGMRTRGRGVVIFNTSRAAVVDVCGASAYCASKAAVVRAAGCLQLEVDAEKKDIQFFSLHPGGVRTDMPTGDAAAHPDMDLIAPGSVARWKNLVNSAVFDVSPNLCAWSSVFLATGAARELRGRYIDVTYDLEETLKQADVVKSLGLYELKAEILGGEKV